MKSISLKQILCLGVALGSLIAANPAWADSSSNPNNNSYGSSGYNYAARQLGGTTYVGGFAGGTWSGFQP